MIFYEAPIVPNVPFYVNGSTRGEPSLKTLSLINNGFRAIFNRLNTSTSYFPTSLSFVGGPQITSVRLRINTGFWQLRIFLDGQGLPTVGSALTLKPFVPTVSGRPTYFVFSLCAEVVSPAITGWVVFSVSLLSLVESSLSLLLESASSRGVMLNTCRSPWPSRLRSPQ